MGDHALWDLIQGFAGIACFACKPSACGVVLLLTSLPSFGGGSTFMGGTYLYWQLSVWWCLVVAVDTCMVFSRLIILPPPSLRYLSQVHQLPMSFKKRDCEHESVWPMIFPHNSVTCIDLGGKYYHEFLIFAIGISWSSAFVFNQLTKFVNFSLCRYLDGFSVFEVGSDGLIHCHRLHKVGWTSVINITCV